MPWLKITCSLGCTQTTISVESGRNVSQSRYCNNSTGAAEYSILYTGTWIRQANSSLLYHSGHTLLEILNLEIVNKEILSCVRCPRLRSEEHTSELQSLRHLVCRLLLEKKKKKQK